MAQVDEQPAHHGQIFEKHGLLDQLIVSVQVPKVVHRGSDEQQVQHKEPPAERNVQQQEETANKLDRSNDQHDDWEGRGIDV